MKTDMIYDIETLMEKIDDLQKQFKENPTYEVAEDLEKYLTMFKLNVGVYTFDELTMYARLERHVSHFLNQADTEKIVDEQDDSFIDSLRVKNIDDIMK